MEDEITNVEGAFFDVAIMDEGSAVSFFESIDVNSSAVFGDAFVVMLHCW
jgi:hypothetical protein